MPPNSNASPAFRRSFSKGWALSLRLLLLLLMGVENAGASVEHFGGRSVSCGEAISSVTFVIATLASVPGTGPSRARHVSQTLGARSAATARRRSRHPTNFHRYDQLDIEWTFQMGFGHEVWEVTTIVGFHFRCHIAAR